ncbi:MAG: alpha/beta hydrolase [Oscillospiraceae bacterium]|jgi:acetyl esterase/lipase|nr:alpha/beta hydrolase [Oscillospiraceae bacterium]
MKKLLALILAAIMLLSIMPAAFAADSAAPAATEESAAQNSKLSPLSDFLDIIIPRFICSIKCLINKIFGTNFPCTCGTHVPQPPEPPKPPEPPPPVRKEFDASYAYPFGEHNLGMSIYLPADINTSNEPRDVLFFLHGGWWLSGDRYEYAGTAQYYASLGFIAVSVDYRLLDFRTAGGRGTVHADEMLDDIGDAISALKAFLEDGGVRIGKCALIGYSAGAHLALLYSYSRGAESAIPIAFCVSHSGPVEFRMAASDLSMNDLIIKVTFSFSVSVYSLFSALVNQDITAGNYQDSYDVLDVYSPVAYASSAIPTILCHGTALSFSDAFMGKNSELPGLPVMAQNTRNVLNEYGVPNTLFSYPSPAGHDLITPGKYADYDAKFLEYAELYM